MKKLFPILLLVVGAACNAPKYSYYFTKPDYQVANKQTVKEIETAATIRIDKSELVATSANMPAITASEQLQALKAQYNSLPNSDKKTFKKELKAELKHYTKIVAGNKEAGSVKATHGMDNDLKLAAIFGIVGIVGMMFYYPIYVIGAIAFIIGVVFFVKWLVRQ